MMELNVQNCTALDFDLTDFRSDRTELSFLLLCVYYGCVCGRFLWALGLIICVLEFQGQIDVRLAHLNCTLLQQFNISQP
jgi:hypothetical protein